MPTNQRHSWIVFSLLALFVLQQFRKKTSETISPNKQAENEHTEPTAEPVLIADETKKHEENAAGSKNHSPRRYDRVFAGTAAVATAGLLIVNIFQSCATQQAATAATLSTQLSWGGENCSIQERGKDNSWSQSARWRHD